jgi:protein-L-isoaspartate(D-aspartate) O-methyltransferase
MRALEQRMLHSRISPRASTAEDLVVILRRAGIHDKRLLDAIRRIPRAAFVPPESCSRAYEDVPLPIAHQQVTTQPSLLALMVQALELRGHERVLEIGTGLGFQTAILASLCQQVVSIEWFTDLAEHARENLNAAGIHNVSVVVGDGSIGYAQRAPFHAIIVAAAAPEVSQALVAQLVEGGRLVQPLGVGGDDRVTAFVRRAGRLAAPATLTRAHFVPLRGGFGIV